MTQPAPEAPQQAQAPADGPQGAQTPPWGEDFDAEKAWNLVTALREDKDKLAKRPTLDADAKRKLAEYDALVESQKTEAQKQADETARWQSEAEKWRATSVGATVKALAATDFADPDDAVRNLDPAKYLDAGGVIDEKAIAADLAALLDAKPHYRRGDGAAPGPRAPRPNSAQGADGRPATDPATLFGSILHGEMK